MHKEIKDNLDESESLFEMANLTQKGTGLPVNLWVDGGGIERQVTHSCYRLKMQNSYTPKALRKDMIPVSIDANKPEILIDTKLKIKKKDFKLVQEFIKRHFNDFDLFIKGEIDEDELKERVYENK